MKSLAIKPKKTEDALIIFSGNPNHAIGKQEAEILNLTVRMKNGVPGVSFVEVWDEGGHFGSGESEKAFPDSVYRRISPDAIVDWLQELFPVLFCNIPDWDSIRQNPQLKAWCKRHKPK